MSWVSTTSLFKLTALVSICSMLLNVQAQEVSDTTRYAVAGLIGNLVECAVFYSIMGVGEDSSGNLSKDSERFLALTEEAGPIALSFGK